MGNRHKGSASREEILRRLNADEELLGDPKARLDAHEKERQRKLKNEIEWEEVRTKNNGAWSGGVL
jgi:hypothetical protein